MNLRQMKYVITIAEEKNISKAAKKLFIAQPSLSQYIHNLENELGVQLFDRTTTPLRLTYAGELYVATAKQIIQLSDQLNKQIEDLTNMKKGRLIIGASPSRCKYLIPSVLPLFYKTFPGIEVVLVEKGIVELEALLQKTEIDMYLTAAPINETDFDFMPLFIENILLALPPKYYLNNILSNHQNQISEDFSSEQIISSTVIENRDKSSLNITSLPVVSLSNFKNDSFVLLEPNQAFHKYSVKLCNEAGFKPKISLVSRSIEACIAMVMANIGLSFVPDTLIKYNTSSQHPFYCAIDGYPTREIVVTYRKNQLTKAAAEFILMTQKIFSDN